MRSFTKSWFYSGNKLYKLLIECRQEQIDTIESHQSNCKKSSIGTVRLCSCKKCPVKKTRWLNFLCFFCEKSENLKGSINKINWWLGISSNWKLRRGNVLKKIEILKEILWEDVKKCFFNGLAISPHPPTDLMVVGLKKLSLMACL